jgi:hypothetical protein
MGGLRDVLVALDLNFLSESVNPGSGELLSALTMGGSRTAATRRNSGIDGDSDTITDQLSRSVAILTRLIVQGIVDYLLKDGSTAGASPSMGSSAATGRPNADGVGDVMPLFVQLRSSKLGEAFATWIANNWKDLLKNPRLRAGPYSGGGASSTRGSVESQRKALVSPTQSSTPAYKPPSAPTGNTTPAGSTTPPSSSLPNSTAKTCSDAPKTITLPKNVNDTLAKLWKNSFPDGKSQEQGGTIVQDKNGAVSVVNTGSGDSGTFSPNRNVGSDQTVIGICHTHPYDKSEGGYTGVSFSGADIAIAANQREPDYVQSGDKQFMIMPTDETPNKLDYSKLNQEQNNRIGELVKGGKSLDEASRIAANETAKKYKMAYYEGSNGVLQRVSC